VEESSNWRLIDTGASGAPARIQLETPGREAQAFNESELAATIRILRMQCQDTTEYEKGFQALIARADSK